MPSTPNPRLTSMHDHLLPLPHTRHIIQARAAVPTPEALVRVARIRRLLVALHLALPLNIHVGRLGIEELGTAGRPRELPAVGAVAHLEALLEDGARVLDGDGDELAEAGAGEHCEWAGLGGWWSVSSG